jgi:hypothetical protein
VLSRVRVPIGLIGIIYESRPNVTADAAALCLRSGNAVLLRGGSEAVHSNRAIHAALVARAGLCRGARRWRCSWCPTQDRAAVGAMLTAAGLIDMIVPRGGKSLVARVQADARVPVLAHLDGICHTYIHAAADPDMARAIALNAKMRRTGICGAMETLLIDARFPAGASVVGALLDAGCELRGDARARALDPRILPPAPTTGTPNISMRSSRSRWSTGWTALDHIARHSSHHTDAIVTEDAGRGRAVPGRSRQRHRHGQRLHPVRRWRRIRAGRGDRHRHRPAARARPGRARRADHLQVAGARHRPDPALSGVAARARGSPRTGLLGGSFNPAHGGHRRITLFALAALGLDEVVVAGLARQSAQAQIGHGAAGSASRIGPAAGARAPIRVTAIERELGTRYTVDTLARAASGAIPGGASSG